MAEFTQKDREFILKAMRSFDEYKKSTDLRLSALEGKGKEVLSPIQRKPRKESEVRRDIPFGAVEEGSSIQIVFRKGRGDEVKQQVLVESLYLTLKQLCEDNDIEQLLIRIEPE